MYESSTQDENYMLYTVSTAIRSRPCLEHDPRWYQSYITETYRYENHVSDKQGIESLKLTDKLSMKNQPEKYSTKPC